VPLALGAFVSGLFRSVRAEAQEARREVLPFRDLFAVLFFVAIGTLVDPGAILRAMPSTSSPEEAGRPKFRTTPGGSYP
jgi:predicted Kef-type K+ transport protein